MSMYRLRRNAFKATQQKAFVTTFFIKMRTNKTANEISDSKGFFLIRSKYTIVTVGQNLISD